MQLPMLKPKKLRLMLPWLALAALVCFLLESTDKLVARAREVYVGASSGKGSTPADDPIGLFADVFQRADEWAVILAEYADAAVSPAKLVSAATTP